MTSRTFLFAFAALAIPCGMLAAACSSSSSTSTTPGGDGGGGGSQDAAIESACGNPGDKGNELGIGKFCATQEDCVGNMNATLCSVLGDDTTHFCTKTCKDPDGGEAGADQCGTNTSCTCNDQGQCGCTPTKCL